MNEQRQKILKMVAEGKITVDEAEQLFDALAGAEAARPTEFKPAPQQPDNAGPCCRPKFLHIQVDPKEGHRHSKPVNIRVPLGLLRAGIKVSSMLPKSTQDKVTEALGEKGINFDFKKGDTESLENIIEALKDMSIDVDDEHEHVRIYCQ